LKLDASSNQEKPKLRSKPCPYRKINGPKGSVYDESFLEQSQD